MEQDKELPSRTVRSIASWRVSQQTIQDVATRRNQSGIIVSSQTIHHTTSNSRNTRVISVDRRIWKKARQIAEKIATTALELSLPKSAAVDKAKVRSFAQSLIVIKNDGSVVVYNNPDQAKRSR